MDRELAALRRGYREQRRAMADDPRPDPDETDETACPFDWSWCSPTADLDDDAMPCLSCYLRQDRDDGGPHPDVDPAGGE